MVSVSAAADVERVEEEKMMKTMLDKMMMAAIAIVVGSIIIGGLWAWYQLFFGG